VNERLGTDDLQQQLQTFLEYVRRQTKVPGVAAAVSLEGRRAGVGLGTLVDGGAEAMSRATLFHLGCVTKLLVSIVVLELAWNKKLDLEAAIAEYLPELAGSVHGRTVKLMHLLSHTSGYRGTNIYEPETQALDWASFVTYLRSAPQYFEPGTVFNYEHTEAVLAAEIVSRVSGRHCIEHIEGSIFRPLGVRPGKLQPKGRTAREHAGQHVIDPLTGRFKPVAWSDLLPSGRKDFSEFWRASFSTVSVSVDDLLALANFIMGQTSRAGAEQPAVSAATLSMLQKPAVLLPRMVGGPLAEMVPASFGFGASRWKDGFYGIGGATYGQCLGFRFDPSGGAAVAVAVNVMQPYLRDLIIGRICEALHGNAHATDPAHDRPEYDFALRDLAGFYRGSGKNALTATLENERLVCVVESGATGVKMRGELVMDSNRGLVLSSPIPHMSLGFFRDSGRGSVAVMVGHNAYKKMK
jgi:CubicO group peptidase (beta-lactamase class C family)